MALTDFWLNQREQVENKHVQQVIAFAGDGKLADGNSASAEFREFLSRIPSSLLQKYAIQCLQDRFDESGFALQDIVNEVGSRLGFRVEAGRYRGTPTQVGHDGIWRFPDGHDVVVEVKTTDAYRIDLSRIAEYQRSLILQDKVSKENTSILLVVGRQDTGDLEAQIRGSRHAWDIRLISVDALMRLMSVKEEVEDPQIVQQISAILIPREFTRLDEIVEIVFLTTEDVKEEELDDDDEVKAERAGIIAPNFLEACVRRIEKNNGFSLVKRTRATYTTPDGGFSLVCSVSKAYTKGDQTFFWFGFHRHQKEFLDQAVNGFVAFGCGSEKVLIMLPARDFTNWLDGMNTSEKGNDLYWHVFIFKEGSKLILHRKKGADRIDLTKYVISK